MAAITAIYLVLGPRGPIKNPNNTKNSPNINKTFEAMAHGTEALVAYDDFHPTPPKSKGAIKPGLTFNEEHCIESRELAEALARDWAAKFPGSVYHVMETTKAFQTEVSPPTEQVVVQPVQEKSNDEKVNLAW